MTFLQAIRCKWFNQIESAGEKSMKIKFYLSLFLINCWVPPKNQIREKEQHLLLSNNHFEDKYLLCIVYLDNFGAQKRKRIENWKWKCIVGLNGGIMTGITNKYYFYYLYVNKWVLRTLSTKLKISWLNLFVRLSNSIFCDIKLIQRPSKCNGSYYTKLFWKFLSLIFEIEELNRK